MTRLYLAGPMTGLPEFNFPAFNAEARRLRALGFEVINPAEVNADTTMSWSACMKKDIPELLTCDGVVLLDGWAKSKGATLERHVAMELGLFVLDAATITEGWTA